MVVVVVVVVLVLMRVQDGEGAATGAWLVLSAHPLLLPHLRTTQAGDGGLSADGGASWGREDHSYHQGLVGAQC